MRYENIDVQVTGAVTKLVLNRPKSLNSFNQAMHSEVTAVLDEVASSDDRGGCNVRCRPG